MGILPSMLAVVIMIVVVTFVAQPFFTARGSGETAHGSQGSVQLLRRRAELLTQRNRIYSAITELDFDYRTNKVSDEDYQEQRMRLVAEGVGVLQQIDALPAAGGTPEDDAIEAAVRALRGGVEPAGAPIIAGDAQPAAGFCPNCGAPAVPGDKFCGACGAQL